MQRKFRIPDKDWQAFCDSLPDHITPSDKLRELITLSPLDQVITVSEAAKLKSVTDRHIRRQCQEGKLTARLTHDGIWLILKSTVKDDIK